MAHYGDPVVDKRGQVIGRVTSCAVDEEGYLLGQAHLKLKYTQADTSIGIFQGAPKEIAGINQELRLGERISVPTPATVLPRFLER
jgi:glycine hydroxymethyltransferase